MRKHEKKKAFEMLEENFHWCPHCGQKPEDFQCDECDKVYIACSCSAMSVGTIENVASNINAIALNWNNYGLTTKWDRQVLEYLTLADKEWLVVYETGHIVSCGSLCGCYSTACEFQNHEEYKNSSFAFFTLENNTPRFMSSDEVFRKLDFYNQNLFEEDLL